MKTLDLIAFILLVIGGLNWGLVGIFSWDLVSSIFGYMSVLSKIVYVLVAVSALYNLFLWNGMHKRWAKTAGQQQAPMQ